MKLYLPKLGLCPTLSLTVKHFWYGMIELNKRHEIYVPANPLWADRLRKWNEARGTKLVNIHAARASFEHLIFTTGAYVVINGGVKPYAWKPATMNLPSHPEWEEPKESHFAIRLGQRVAIPSAICERYEWPCSV